MTEEILSELPIQKGHFLLESGYHSDLWLTLDGLFVDSEKITPLVDALAQKLRSHDVSAVCVKFFYSEPGRTGGGLFKAEYRLSSDLMHRVRGERVALVDDAISAGSSVRATKEVLDAAGAVTVVVAALVTLGTTGVSHFVGRGVPVSAMSDGAIFN